MLLLHPVRHSPMMAVKLLSIDAGGRDMTRENKLRWGLATFSHAVAVTGFSVHASTRS